MRVDKLYEGQIFKNYRDLCDTLEIDYKRGLSKTYQLEDIYRYCVLHKKGHSLTVTEVFEEPVPKIEKRGRKSLYGDLLQLIMLDYFLRIDKPVLILTRNKLMRDTNMVNERYQSNSYDIKSLSQELDIPVFVTNEFYNLTRSNFSYVIDSTLDALRNRSLIIYSKITMLAIDNEHRMASVPEKLVILEAEKSVLKSLGYQMLSQVVAANKWKLFTSRVLKLLKTSIPDVDYYYTSYHITVNREHIENDYEIILKGILTNEERLEKETNLNNQICETMLNNAKNRKSKSESEEFKKERDFMRISENYIRDNHKLISYLIKKE